MRLAFLLALVSLGISLPLLEQSGCGVDNDGDGSYTPDDCDDSNPDTYPGASELCDGEDNNCNGAIDEGSAIYFRDQDGDGFGDMPLRACGAGAGVVTVRGDCDDTQRTVYPGAADSSSDGIDQDCGGTTASDPHVGLGGDSLTTLQAALEASQAGNTIWVGPGTYRESQLTFAGKNLRLRSTHGAEQTTVDATGLGSVFLFSGGEGREALLDGFTITGGKSDYGGGIRFGSSSPTIANCIIRDNSAMAGGAFFLEFSNPLVSYCSLSANKSASGGGAFFAMSSSPTFDHCTLFANSSASGGGGYGYWASVTMTHCIADGNRATQGGFWCSAESNLSMSHCVVRANIAQVGGAFADAWDFTSFVNCSIIENNASDKGGAFYNSSSKAVLTNCVLTRNSAALGGAMFTRTDMNYAHLSPQILNTIMAYNDGYNLYNSPEASSSLGISYSLLYSPDPTMNHNLTGLDSTVLETEPAFLTYEVSGLPSSSHLALGSPAVNTGSPDLLDLDGSRSDMGAYGGPNGGTRDLDGDGWPDWFWPGTLEQVPSGFSRADYDLDDEDSSVH